MTDPTMFYLFIVAAFFVVGGVIYAIGEFVGYRRGVQDESARWHKPIDVVQVITSGWGSEPEDYQLQNTGR